ncbi:molybdenum cofactor sulfurase-like [Physella acuta]|uniref:molybdenum cofactor sulfurase-like n=1 Tax=Physella acuta TaxID=109671 RepID=UPI0027DBF289|nr:molybdenum cofactor sulfurase-like [Physella acuta]
MYNYKIEDLRSKEFPQLQKGAVYVDHAGATLFSSSQIEAVQKDLLSTLYGNPHSHNASSKLATDTIDQIRYRLLKFFNTNHEEYSLIFTSGCTASLKLIAESFTFNNGASTSAENSGAFCYLEDSHTSVQGMREVVANRCSQVVCLDDQELITALNSPTPDPVSHKPPQLAHDKSTPVDSDKYLATNPQSLVAFPAQSNFSGKRYPLSWIKQIQEKGITLPGKSSAAGEKWFVLLDAASLVSTSRLNLGEVQPDFVTVSFYKIFGYPTGLGALLVHKRAWGTLRKCYFGGGTVAVSTAKERFHVFREALHDRFEDGTIPFLSIISLRHGLDTVQKLAGGMDNVSEHVFAVTQYFHSNLQKLHHNNGQPLAQIYGDLSFDSPKGQGGIVTFNLLRADGKFIGFAEVDKFAQLHDVHLRTGCFCNIGACQKHLNLSAQLIKDNFAAGHVCGDNMDLINGRPTGAVRISFGYMSTISDARVCLRFIADSFLENPTPIPQFPDPVWYRKNETADVGLNESQHSTKIIKDEKIHAEKSFHNQEETTAASVSKSCNEKVRKLTDIFLYPVKSCGAFRVSDWEMGSKGLLYDREWVLVSDTGVTIGQKREPRICLLKPYIDLDSRKLILSFPDASPFELPLDQEEDFDAMASLCTNKVCGDRVNTYDCGDAVSDWLSDIFQMPGVRLLRQQSDDTRKSNLKDNTVTEDPDKPKLSMANESQLLLLSRVSVRELQKKMVEIVDVDDAQDTKMPTAPADISEDNLVWRFRGNLVFDGGKEFEEENWASISLGGNTIVCQGACSRCQMICMDQETGQKSREPLRTLGVWRGKKVPFGVHARMLPSSDGARQFLHVGDIISVLD